MDLGHVGALLNLSDPLAPKYDLAFEGPDPSSPLSFLSPVSAQFVAHLDTTGVVQAALIGAHTLVERLFDGTLQLGLDAIANGLDADRSRPLARLLNFDPQAPITADLLRSRLTGLFASSVSGLATLNIDQSATSLLRAAARGVPRRRLFVRQRNNAVHQPIQRSLGRSDDQCARPGI